MLRGIKVNTDWQAVEKTLKEEDIKTLTNKLVVGEFDLYFKLGFYPVEGDPDGRMRPVMVDITFTRAGSKETFECEECDMRESRRYEDMRSYLEVVCRQASALLQANIWTLNDLSDMWIMTRFEPSGACEQIAGIAKSPLDACAKLVRANQARWSLQMREKKEDAA